MTLSYEWDDLARTKLVRVLGVSEGELVFARTLPKTGKPHLRSANDVYEFAQFLKTEAPVIAAVGSMLALAAVMRGADPAEINR